AVSLKSEPCSPLRSSPTIRYESQASGDNMITPHQRSYPAGSARISPDLAQIGERDLNVRQLARPSCSGMLAPIYRVYEHRLVRQVQAFPVPRHIGLILDGNRRFGRVNGLHPDDAYMAGANKLDELLEWCIDLEIPAITLWVFSTEN